jgi:hypothetical protein
MLTPNTNAAQTFIQAGEAQLQDTPLAENHVRKPCMRPVFSVPDDALTPLRELTRTIVNWIIDAVEETDNDKYLASTEAFLSLPCLLQDEEGVLLRNNPAKHALDSCLAKRADPNDVIQHVLNHRNQIFNARINRPSRPPKPTTTRNTLQRAKNLVDAKRPADALKSIETAGTLGILTSAQSLTESIREELFELHPSSDNRDALPADNPYDTSIFVTAKQVAEGAENLPRMKATAMSPWSNELIGITLKDVGGLHIDLIQFDAVRENAGRYTVDNLQIGTIEKDKWKASSNRSRRHVVKVSW